MALKPSDSEPATPRATPAYEWDSDTALERIKEISQNARSTWFGLLALMTFVLVTLLGVQDVDFFGYGRFTQLPLVNVQVPTELFFWAGPPLAAATYAYFHFYLLRLWDALGRAPATHKGDPFSEHVYPWLLTDAALRRRPDAAARRRALGSAAELTSLIITWLFGLIVLFFAWWRSMVAHDPALSTLTLICFLFAATAGMTSWVMLHRRVTRRVHGPVGRLVWRGWRKRGGIRAAVFLLVLTLFKTWWGHPEITEIGLTKNALMANANLTDASLTIRPNDWLARPLAELKARKDWCNRRNLSWSLCVKPPGDAHQVKARQTWCSNNLDDQTAPSCDAHFTRMEAAFQSEWRERRAAYLAVLKKPDLKGRDLRAASLFGAFLPGVLLNEARLEGANLSGARLEGAVLYRARLVGAVLYRARLEGAVLIGARLEGADLSEAQLEGANLSGAQLVGADLSEAQLEGANLSRARLEGADLSEAQLVGADLSEAQLVAADLSEAQLEGANLSRARLVGANLSEAQFQSAEFSGATIGPSPLNSADFTGVKGVTQDMLEAAVGDADTVLPAVDGAPLYVWSCWEEAPANFDALIEMQFWRDRDELREQWLCATPADRVKTGRMAKAEDGGDDP